MPWNDTAQLNFLNPEVREAVVQTILHVARKFPIIRFDAAMTLTKRHYQRLWFPEPGTGGAIPSRAEYGLTKEQFDAAMPQEFWREVVDRVAREVPDTLLLAEAFWLMEGYFVRTLGMHRVYNSAFMNMLKNEENANYRSVMKNTLEFDPQILKRFVNFMNNPDEQTAVAQFGKHDKYFGVCTMLATLPGLPMFGHGQVEGLTEKYGMEFRRAYWDERPDEQLIQRHQREIFPLLRLRHLFAESEHFLLYDCFTPEGHVNEDVFAYSNRAGNERALVVYHNKNATTSGWIRTSVGFLGKTGQGETRALMQRDLGAGLALHPAGNLFCIYRDQVTGLEYIRSSKELCEKGLPIELGPYKYHVFLHFREERDSAARPYAQLAAYLAGKGVPSVKEALREIFLQPLHQPFKEQVNAPLFRQLMKARLKQPKDKLDIRLLDGVEQKMVHLFGAIKQYTGSSRDEKVLAHDVRQELAAALQLPILPSLPPWSALAEKEQNGPGGLGDGPAEYLKSSLGEDLALWGSIFGWVFVHPLGRIDGEKTGQLSRSWMDEWLLDRILAGALHDLGLDEAAVRTCVAVVKILTSHQRWYAPEGTAIESAGSGDQRRAVVESAESEDSRRTLAYRVLEKLLKDSEVQQFLQVNRYQDILWFNKEMFAQLLWWLWLVVVIQVSDEPEREAGPAAEEIRERFRIVQALQQAGGESEYQVERLLTAAKNSGRAAGSERVGS
jgi:hypothetical protein